VILEESATLRAVTYCNLHGSWEATKSVSV
jgi:desulfoferrodoxin (superoxide reductase-like protein)